MSMGPIIVDKIITIGRSGGDRFRNLLLAKIVSGYDKELPQSQAADKPIPWHCKEEPHNKYGVPGTQTKQSYQLSVPHQNDCKTRMDIM